MDRCYDRLCYYETQQKIKWWLIPLGIFLLVLAVAAVVIISFVIIPHVRTNVADARLDTFSFAARTEGGWPAAVTSLFSYNISIALAILNPNRAMGIEHTKPFVATFVFHDRRLQNLTVVEAGHKHRPGKTEIHLLHAGEEVPGFLLGNAAAEDLKKQDATGLFKVEVRLSGEITHQRIAIAKKRKLSMSCPLELQLAPPGPEVVVFHEVCCKPVKQDKMYF
ncbi:hypothetical protein PVAP13_7NG012900 [Panicum virgatum]|jgi:hypothetical protein|uniref:Late embryogenesis abundant protein LEA-2 subgroup domain-containing protein n=1 Tax=Panicum virgatum TaxID=38727 RepID=A0A8T0PY64_PANVG|nr:hypothetical protein PVAP13_7NG012900 [Panicum virgatum]